MIISVFLWWISLCTRRMSELRLHWCSAEMQKLRFSQICLVFSCFTNLQPIVSLCLAKLATNQKTLINRSDFAFIIPSLHSVYCQSSKNVWFQVYCRIRPFDGDDKCVGMLNETTVQVTPSDVSIPSRVNVWSKSLILNTSPVAILEIGSIMIDDHCIMFI